MYVSNIVEKASKRLYLLKQVKRAEVETSSVDKFYTAFSRSVVEYTCPVFHLSLPNYLSCEIESVRRLPVIFTSARRLTKTSITDYSH